MLCGKPITVTDKLVPCGQCMNCRINRKRKTVAQLIMEATHCENSSAFVTLTYSDKNLPHAGSLSPRDMEKFTNRLRATRGGGLGPIRYFYVGEYGDRTQRPHYHMALFNVSPERAEAACSKLWSNSEGSLGFVHTGEITARSIDYIAGYCTKKMGRGHPDLEGRYPEFNRRSRRPPLGYNGALQIIDTLQNTRRGQAALDKQGDAPSELRYNGKIYPLPDYWREFIRRELGLPESPDFQPAWTIDYEGYFDAYEKATKREEINASYVKASKAKRTL